MKFLVITGAVLILLAIMTGWIIIAVKYLSLTVVKKIFRDDEKLVKAHIDYLIMGILLLVFYATGINLPFEIAVLACAGALANPSLFLFLSMKPDVNKKTGSLFSIVSTAVFLITTAGIGGAALLLIQELIP